MLDVPSAGHGSRGRGRGRGRGTRLTRQRHATLTRGRRGTTRATGARPRARPTPRHESPHSSAHTAQLTVSHRAAGDGIGFLDKRVPPPELRAGFPATLYGFIVFS